MSAAPASFLVATDRPNRGSVLSPAQVKAAVVLGLMADRPAPAPPAPLTGRSLVRAVLKPLTYRGASDFFEVAPPTARPATAAQYRAIRHLNPYRPRTP